MKLLNFLGFSSSFKLWVALLACLESSQAISPRITPLDFSAHVKALASKVEDFEWIAKTAKKYHLSAWLFGGTASTFAHYAREDMLREKGMGNLEQVFFAEDVHGKRDSTDIFRPTQDIDLVVDGKMENVRAFEREVLANIPDLREIKAAGKSGP